VSSRVTVPSGTRPGFPLSATITTVVPVVPVVGVAESPVEQVAEGGGQVLA
jgi:hypothetical protein